LGDRFQPADLIRLFRRLAGHPEVPRGVRIQRGRTQQRPDRPQSANVGPRASGPTSLTLPTTPIPDYSGSHARLAVSKLVMDMSKRDERTSDRELRPIGWVRAHALMIWGPAQSWDNPLMGTRYDPVLRQDQLRARHARREARREGREQRRLDRARIGDEHCTPDE